MKETTNSFTKSFWRNVCAIVVACSWSLAASAQPQTDATTDTTQQTNKAAIQAEEAEKARLGLKAEDGTQSTAGSSEWDSWWEDWEGKGTQGVRREAVVAIWKN